MLPFHMPNERESTEHYTENNILSSVLLLLKLNRPSKFFVDACFDSITDLEDKIKTIEMKLDKNDKHWHEIVNLYQ